MIEDRFSYRIVCFVNEADKGSKHYMDTPYSGLRKSLENFIRNHLSLTNSIVVAETTVMKDGKCICLQSRTYPFSLAGYFERINGECGEGSSNEHVPHGRYVAKQYEPVRRRRHG